jgi:protease-4
MMHRSGRRHPVVALAVLAALALWGVGCISINLPGGVPKPLVESVVHGDGDLKILLVQIEGVISDSRDEAGLFSLSQESMVTRFREQLDKARGDDDVRAVILRINSPGGTVTASDILYDELLRFKRERRIPVIAQLMGLATSGGYYVAMAADEIVAHPTTVTGSIGVIFMGVNLAGLMEKLGIEDQTLTTGPYKDAGSMFRTMRPEERTQLLSVLDDLFARFKQVVRSGRGALSAEQVDTLADGRIFSAEQARSAGLVDDIGGLEDTVERAEQSAGIPTSRVVTYHRPREWRENLYTRAPTAPTVELDLIPDWPGVRRPAFLYLWTPGAP